MWYLFYCGEVAPPKAREGLATSGGFRGCGGSMESTSGPPTSIGGVTAVDYVTCWTGGGANWSLVPETTGSKSIPIGYKGVDPSDTPKSKSTGVIQVDLSKTVYPDSIFDDPVNMIVEGQPDPLVEYLFKYEWKPTEEIKDPIIRAIAKKIYRYFEDNGDSMYVGFMIMTEPQFVRMKAARSFTQLVQGQNGGHGTIGEWVVKDLPGKGEEYGIVPQKFIDGSYRFDPEVLLRMRFDCSWLHQKRDNEGDGKHESEGRFREILPGNKLPPCGYLMNLREMPLLPTVDDKTTVLFIKFELDPTVRGKMVYYGHEGQCAICFDEFKTKDPVLIPLCGHAKFCRKCVHSQIRKGSYKCALCLRSCPEKEIKESVFQDQ